MDKLVCLPNSQLPTESRCRCTCQRPRRSSLPCTELGSRNVAAHPSQTKRTLDANGLVSGICQQSWQPFRWSVALANSAGQHRWPSASRVRGNPLWRRGSDTLSNFTDRLRWSVALANSAGQLRWPSASRVRGNPLWKKRSDTLSNFTDQLPFRQMGYFCISSLNRSLR